VLFDFLLRGLFEHRMIHADPNLADFWFLADGRVVVCDYGCVKSVPRPMVKGWRELSRAALDGRRGKVPEPGSDAQHDLAEMRIGAHVRKRRRRLCQREAAVQRQAQGSRLDRAPQIGTHAHENLIAPGHGRRHFADLDPGRRHHRCLHRRLLGYRGRTPS
jgi:hypothetical protein